MNVKIIAGIAIPIIILIIAVPIFLNSASNLQQINKEKENAKPLWISNFAQLLGGCDKTSGGLMPLANCKEAIPLLQQQCSFYDNPPVCNDPRINEILSANTPNPTFTQSPSFTTYTNNNLGFSIDYPSNWVVDESPDYGNVGIKDRMNAPNVLFQIKQMQSNGNSFDDMASKYDSESGFMIGNSPINIQSTDKVKIGTKDAYRIHYTIAVGSTTCNDEDYVINGDNFVTVIHFDNCDQGLYTQFLTTYENMVSTFR